MSRTGAGVAVLAIVLGLDAGVGACSSRPPLQAMPCPASLPEMGSPCMPAGEQCGYAKSTRACGVACDCLGGAWSCGPACIIDELGDAAAEASTEAAADAGAE